MRRNDRENLVRPVPEWSTGEHGCLVHPTSGSFARLPKHEVVVSDLNVTYSAPVRAGGDAATALDPRKEEIGFPQVEQEIIKRLQSIAAVGFAAALAPARWLFCSATDRIQRLANLGSPGALGLDQDAAQLCETTALELRSVELARSGAPAAVPGHWCGLASTVQVYALCISISYPDGVARVRNAKMPNSSRMEARGVRLSALPSAILVRGLVSKTNSFLRGGKE